MVTRYYTQCTVAFLGDMLALVAAFVLAFWLRKLYLVVPRHPFLLREQLHVLAVCIPIFTVSFYHFGLYRKSRAIPFPQEFVLITKAELSALLALVFFLFWLKYVFASRIFLVLLGIFSYILVVLVRWGQYRLIRIFIQESGSHVSKIAVVGSNTRTRRIIEAIQAHNHLGIELVGQFGEGELEEPSNGLRDLGTLENFANVVRNQVLDAIVFSVRHNHMEAIREPLAYCLKAGIQVFVDANPFEELDTLVRVEEFAGINFLTVPATALTERQLFLKRCLDLILASGLLIGFCPVMLVAAALVKLFGGPGPIFFRQLRVGINGRRFTLYKFRTMVDGAEKIRTELSRLNEMDGPVFKIRDDPRITPVGRFLRRASIDELPQLFNVLLGHMSAVGPRPPLPDEIEQYELWQRRRLSMKPGLTCLWQVSGRNKVDFHTWMKMDLDYIDNWSWLLDVKILLRTFPAMFQGE